MKTWLQLKGIPYLGAALIHTVGFLTFILHPFVSLFRWVVGIPRRIRENRFHKDQVRRDRQLCARGIPFTQHRGADQRNIKHSPDPFDF